MSVFYPSQRDPVDNSIADYYYWMSTSSTGNSTTIFDDLVCPASPNFPASTLASRYMSYFPGEIDYDGVIATTRPLIIKDVNTTTFLSRVAPGGSLTANTYKIFPGTAETPSRVEFHSGQAGHSISYHGYFINSIATSTDFNDINCNSVYASTIAAKNIDANIIPNYTSTGYFLTTLTATTSETNNIFYIKKPTCLVITSSNSTDLKEMSLVRYFSNQKTTRPYISSVNSSEFGNADPVLGLLLHNAYDLLPGSYTIIFSPATTATSRALSFFTYGTFGISTTNYTVSDIISTSI